MVSTSFGRSVPNKASYSARMRAIPSGVMKRSFDPAIGLAGLRLAEIARDMKRALLGLGAADRIINHAVLDHALDIAAGLGERDRLDPADDVDAAARVAIAIDPFADVARA